MPEKRAFGTELSVNRPKHHEFSPVQKAAMVGELSAGKTHRAVAALFNTTPSTTYKIFKRWKTTQSIENKKRSGRPPKLTMAEKRYIIIMLKKNHKITYDALVGAMGGRVSKSTIRRCLRKDWARKWKAMERIPLTKETAAQRLEFARYWMPIIDELMEIRGFKLGNLLGTNTLK
jgi:transposase